MIDDIFHLFPDNRGQMPESQVEALRALCEAVAKVAHSSGNTALFMRATSLHYKLSR